MTEQNLFPVNDQDKAEFEALRQEGDPEKAQEQPPDKKSAADGQEGAAEDEKSAEVKDDQDKQEQQPRHHQTARERVQQSRQQVAEARRALDEERRARKEFEGRVQQRLDALLESKAPDPDVDPEGFARHQQDQVKAIAKERDELRQQQAKERETHEQAQKLTQWVSEVLADFEAEHPDYRDAETYLINKEIERLMDEEGATREGARQEVNAALSQRVIAYHDKNWNPCRWVYAQAKKAGFNGEGKPQNEEKSAKKTGDLKALTAGKAATKTTRGTGSGRQGLTVEELAAMSDEDFTKYASDHKKLKKVFGE